jgi:hypothetical protein
VIVSGFSLFRFETIATLDFDFDEHSPVLGFRIWNFVSGFERLMMGFSGFVFEGG